MKEVKSSGTAIVLSFFLTGLGQLYAGRIGRGILMMILTPVLWAIGWFGGFATLLGGLGGLFGQTASERAAAGGFGLVGFLFAAVPIVWWIWGMVDANNLCKQFNEAAALQGKRSSPGVGLAPQPISPPSEGGPAVQAAPQVGLDLDVSHLTKKCPQCAELINLEALVCRFCAHKFDEAAVKAGVESAKALALDKLGRVPSAREQDLLNRAVCPQCEAWQNLEHTPETILCKSCNTRFRRV